MLPYIPAIGRCVAGLLRHRVTLLLIMIGASYALWGLLRTEPPAQAVTSSCAVNTDDYFSTLPNGFGAIIYQNTSCQTCHTVAPTRGPFGSDYEAQTLKGFADGSFAHTWNSTLAFKDSDGDGYTNGEELQDPSGNWAFGTAAPGNANLVTSPNDKTLVPAAPAFSTFTGVTSGSSYAGSVNLNVTLTTNVGARKVVYDILNGATLVKSYIKQTDSAVSGGYTANSAFFNIVWDTNDVPNGTYTVRATLTEARSAAAGGPRVITPASIANVTINNPSRTLRYVATTGSDTANACTNSASPCATIDRAVGVALANDEIRVAGGTYATGTTTSTLTINTRVKLIGGYMTANWNVSDPKAHPTKLDRQGPHTVLAFGSTAAGFTVQNLTIQHGSAANGGGIVGGAQGTFNNITFDSNAVSAAGGALFLSSAAAGTVIQNAIFVNNSAGQYGGAIASIGNFTASNILFVKNSAQLGGGAIAVNFLTNATINYATIVGSGSGDAIRMLTNTGPMTLRDTLISGYPVGATVDAGAVLNLDHVLMANDGANNVATPTTGGGTISGTPIRGLAGYKNAAAGDYHLLFGAPAIDAGVALGGITTDLDGLARPFTTPLPNVVLTAPDIGAYEYSSPYGVLYFLTGNLNVTLPVQVAHIQVNLTVPALRPVTVQYATQDSDAHAGVDYTAKSGTLTIPAGDAEVLFDIPILATNLTTARSFFVNLSSPTIAQLNIVSSMMVTINPPDLSGPPRVVLTASTPDASRAGPVPGVFTLTRDQQLDAALTVNYTVGGTAVAGTDYAPLPGSVTFQPGQPSATIEVRPIGGSGDKLLTLTLTPDGAYLLGRSSATVGITGILSHRILLPLVRR